MNSLLNPKSVAVIGVSREPTKIGYLVFDNLLSGFSGKVFGVNPNADVILGQKIYPTVLDINEDVDLAVICVPAKITANVLESCGKKGVEVAIIISAGFSEIGSLGKEAEEELKKVAQKFNMRILGPNCLGAINNFRNLNASFATAKLPTKYRVGVFSQSGAMGAAILDFANGYNFGFSYFVSLGNKADISEIDLLNSWKDDDAVEIAIGYLEDTKDGTAFLEAMRNFTAKKPLIILKGGMTKDGQEAARLHTSAMLQDNLVFQAALKEGGAIIAENLNDLFDFAIAFSENKLPKGRNLAIISNAGGPSVLAADACSKEDINLASLSAHTLTVLSQKTKAASINNPIDLRGDASSKDYGLALDLCLSDPNVDGIMVMATPQAMTEIEEIAWEVVRAHKKSSKPIYVNFIGGELVGRATSIVRENGVPSFSYPERAVRAFSYQANFKYHQIKTTKVMSNHHSYEAVRSILKFSGGKLDSVKLFSVLRLYGVPMAQTMVIHNAEEALEAPQKIKPPLVMKILSPDILHKTDVGGVILGVSNAQEACEAFKKIIANVKKNCPKAKIEGITVMEMAKEGLELIVGVKKDPNFGPVLMFGFGGVLVELILDFAISIAPFTEKKVKAMINSTAAAKIIAGYRGSNQLSEKKLIKAILGLTQLVIDHPEISQVEINPLVMSSDGKGIMGLDAKIEIKLSDDKMS